MTLIETEECFVTLKQLVDMINNERAKDGVSLIRHDRSMDKVTELATHAGFGQVSILTLVIERGQGATIDMDTYCLTSKQAITVSAKLDNKRLIQVIDHLAELTEEKKAVPQLTDDEMIANAMVIAHKILEKTTQELVTSKQDNKFLSEVLVKNEKVTNEMADKGKGLIVGDWAKQLTDVEIGLVIRPQELRTYLKSLNCLRPNGLPYQTYVNNLYFKIREGSYTDNKGNDVPTYTTIITPKGMRKLHDKVIKHFSGEYE